jgi:polyribonucleotide nucleotidyltransferase
MSGYSLKSDATFRNIIEVSEGQEIMVKCIGIDEKSGKIKLSRKALIPKPEGADAEPEGEAASHDDRPRRPRAPRRS